MPLNPDALRARATALRTIRETMDRWGYLETPTPCVVDSPAMEEHLYPIGTSDGRFLRTSPEFALKRVVSAGLPRVYEIGPSFRADEKGPWHSTEFLMLEWYRVGAHVTDLMQEVEELVGAVALALGVSAPENWETTSVRDCFLSHTNLDLAKASAEDLAPNRGLSWDEAFFIRWLDEVEPNFPQAIHVHSWPASQAALAQVRTNGWPYAVRFESYLNGVELCNAFLELNDDVEQRERFAQANAYRVAHGDPPHPIDESFLDAVGTLPTTAGIALGVERLVAALLNLDGITQLQV